MDEALSFGSAILKSLLHLESRPEHGGRGQREAREAQVKKYRRLIELLEADLGDELVALDLKSGNCFGFNEVAAWVWRRLAEPASFDQLHDELITQFDVSREQCTHDLGEFVNQMVGRGIIGPTL